MSRRINGFRAICFVFSHNGLANWVGGICVTLTHSIFFLVKNAESYSSHEGSQMSVAPY